MNSTTEKTELAEKPLEKPQEKSKVVQIEEQILDFWDENKIFEKSLAQTADSEPFVFFDGPPFATGTPHYGHILASAIKDAIPRYWTMKGYYVRRRWGWDCHGLPIEQLVEQKLGISGKKDIEALGIEKFCEECRGNVLGFVHDWAKTVRRIGRFVDFENSYKTMDATFMESVWWAIKKIWEKGLIYEDRKVLMYCSRCETPVSNFEVAMDNSYKDATEDSIYLQSRLSGTEQLAQQPTYILFWTTTPWTIPGNVALAVGPDIDYVLIQPREEQYAGRQYVLAKAQAEVLFNNPEILGEFKGEDLEGLHYEPLYDIPELRNAKSHTIYTADFVTTEDGTGVVHTAVMYGEDDYALGLKHGLPTVPLLNARGEFIAPAPSQLVGSYYKKAEKVIMQEIEEDGSLFKTLAYTHSVPFCWRCGTRLYYSAIPAWFMNIQKVKPRLRELNQEQITWYPEHLKNGRFDKGLENAPDWNISRNRYWATPLPFWKCDSEDCKHVECIGSVEELKQKAQNFDDIFPSADVKAIDLHRPTTDQVVLDCAKCGGVMHRIAEVVDCWLESASMPFAEFHAPFENEEEFNKFFPAQFVAEYIGQTRAWFYYMHAVNTILFDTAPFQNILTTGVVQAEDGKKMSKSKKNYPDPDIVIDKYGADILRFYLLTSSVVQAENLNFSERELEELSRKLLATLLNVHSFYRLFRTAGTIDGNLPSAVHLMDRWILAMLHQLQVEVTMRLDAYDLVRAGKAILQFVSDLSTWYVRRTRDRVKNGGTEAESALNVMGYVIAELAKLMAPFTPMTADYFYKDVTGNESVHLVKWNLELATQPLTEDEKFLLLAMEGGREIVELGLSARKESALKVRQPLSELSYMRKVENQALEEWLEMHRQEFQQIIAEELNVKQVRRADQGQVHLQPVLKESAAYAISLDTALTPELREEGLARELERQVQDLRKKFGLQVGDMIDLYYNTTDAALEMALVGLFDRRKTFTMQIKKELEIEVDFEIQAEIDGAAIWLGIVKI